MQTSTQNNSLDTLRRARASQVPRKLEGAVNSLIYQSDNGCTVRTDARKAVEVERFAGKKWFHGPISGAQDFNFCQVTVTANSSGETSSRNYSWGFWVKSQADMQAIHLHAAKLVAMGAYNPQQIIGFLLEFGANTCRPPCLMPALR